MRTFEYRLFPNRAQRQQLMACLIESRAIYNEMLADLKAQYETDGTFPTKYDLTARFRGRGGDVVPATTVQTLADRLSKALKRFLQTKDLGLPVGFPRFKTPNRWHSIQLPPVRVAPGCVAGCRWQTPACTRQAGAAAQDHGASSA